MGPDLILVAGVLIDVRRDQDRKALHLGGQRHRTLDLCARALGCLDNLLGGIVDQTVVKGLQTDAYILVCGHGCVKTPEYQAQHGPNSPRTVILRPAQKHKLLF